MKLKDKSPELEAFVRGVLLRAKSSGKMISFTTDNLVWMRRLLDKYRREMEIKVRILFPKGTSSVLIVPIEEEVDGEPS